MHQNIYMTQYFALAITTGSYDYNNDRLLKTGWSLMRGSTAFTS